MDFTWKAVFTAKFECLGQDRWKRVEPSGPIAFLQLNCLQYRYSHELCGDSRANF